MCGITGYWDFKNKADKEILESMNNCLSHRGPDDKGIFIDEHIGLSQTRLSIIDLSEKAHQPMKAGDSVIVYNGEAYNYEQVGKELGEKLFSTSDTEVVLRAYMKWGIEGIKRFRGMFAMAVWDKEKLTLIRDRAGIKPLYYYFHNGLFVFASEIKAIVQHPKVKKDLDFNALSLFLQLGYIPAPYSIFKHIRKLEPGHSLTLQDKKIIKEKYWDVLDYYLQDKIIKSEQDIERELEDILTESFKLRMVSDVEVGHFLSGGIDSSTVAAILVKKLGLNLKTFTIGFKDRKYNEAEYAKQIANYLGTEHYELYCTEKEAKDIVPLLPNIYDEPFGDYSGIPTYLLSKFARDKVKVSLSADGGDEAFCGYDKYWIVDSWFKKFQTMPNFLIKGGLEAFNVFSPELLGLMYKVLRLPKQNITKDKVYKLRKKINKLKQISKNPGSLMSFYKLMGFGFWKEPELSKLLGKQLSPPTFFDDDARIEHLDNISRMQAIDYKTYMNDDILVKVDRATMAVGLEGRDPLLDHNIIEYAARLPLNMKYRNKQSKYILRKILYKYVPKELLERPKQGFNVPLNSWLRGDLKYLLDNYLGKSKDIFNTKLIEQEKNKFLDKGIDYAEHLWLLIVFEMWREKWM